MKNFVLQSTLLTENLEKLLSSMVTAIPRLFGGLIFLLVGIFIARAVSRLVKMTLSKIGVDKLGEKLGQIEIVANANIDFKISTLAEKVIYYFVLLIFVVGATDIIGISALSDLFNDILNWVPNLMVALVILILGLLFSELIRKAVQTACESLGIPSARLVSLFAFYFLFINIVISALAQAKVDTSFISSNISILIGSITLAFAIGYGLAARNIMSNFLASYYTKDKIAVGDTIRVEDVEGVITKMDRTTLTIASDGKQIIIPLNIIASKKLEIIKQG